MDQAKCLKVSQLAKEVADLADQVAKLKSPYSNGKLTGSLRRRSMDLTRALAELRKT